MDAALEPWAVGSAAAALGGLIGWWANSRLGRGSRGDRMMQSVVTAALSAVAAVWTVESGRLASLPALLVFAAAGVALSLIDLERGLLPTRIVVATGGAITAMLVLASVLTGDWWALARGLSGALALFALYLSAAVVRPGAMGGGDIRLAPVIGGLLGWIGWGELVVGALAAFLLGGGFGIALLIGKRASRGTAIPFGPFMAAGAWAGILWGGPIVRALTG